MPAPVNLSAATLGLEWTKTSLGSVEASLQAESNAVVESLQSLSAETAASDDDIICQLRRRGVLLKNQHRLLLKLFRRFRSQGQRVKQICDGDHGRWSPQVDGSQTADTGELVAGGKSRSHGEVPGIWILNLFQ